MTSQAIIRSRHKRDFALAKQMANEGYGWEDVQIACGLTERESRMIVLGKKW